VLVKDVKLVVRMVMVVNLLKIVEVEQVVQEDSIRMVLRQALGDHKEVMVL
jgi:hypothetical protein